MAQYATMDQSSWKCFELAPNKYYYGEIGYVDATGIVNMAEGDKTRIVRHGFGVEIHSNTTYKYEGSWEKDLKEGEGKLTLQNGTHFQGTFKEGMFHGNGKIKWENGHSFEGSWRKGKMEGVGTYHHANGEQLKGAFKANYLIQENVLRDPTMSNQEYIVYKKQKQEVWKQKEKNQKAKFGFVVKESNYKNIYQKVKQSNNNNRVPIIIASEESKITLMQFQKVIETESKQQINVFDLRKASLEVDKEEQKRHLNVLLKQTLINGQVLIISLDESQVQYKETYYPDLKQFYDGEGFNSNTWSRKLLQEQKIKEKIIGEKQINLNYLLIVWSKIKIHESTKEQRIKQQLQLRFQSIIPFSKCDIVFIISPNQQK